MKGCLRVAVFSFLTLMILGLTGAAALPVLAGETVLPVADSEVKAKMATVQVPFVENQGQISAEQVKFYAQTFAGTVFITDDGICYELPTGEEGGWVLKEEFAGGKDPVPVAASAPGAPINYYLGTVEKHLPSYQEITLGEVFDKINVNLKAYGNNVEKIFTVAPDGDPTAIALKVTGADGLSINEQGELELATGLGTVRMTSPVAYQIIDGRRVDVNVTYVVKDDTYGFAVGEYDRAYPLVIDPLLAATLLGGSGDDYAYAMALDTSGNVYVAGNTKSDTIAVGGYDTGYDGSVTGQSDVLVAKFNSGLTQLLAATYLGGSATDSATGLALDANGGVYVTGYTKSSEFPTPNGYSNTYNYGATTSSYWDSFVAKLSDNLSELHSATFIGGKKDDRGYGIGLDSQGNVYVAGYTNSNNLVPTSGVPYYKRTLNSTAEDAFIVKYSNDLSTYLAGTYIGGKLTDNLNAMVVDATGNVYISGNTLFYSGNNFPTTQGAYLQTNTKSGKSYGFVAKFSDIGSTSGLAASTFLSSSDGIDSVKAMVLDSLGNVYVTGSTSGTDFPTTTGVSKNNVDPNTDDIFVTKFNGSLTAEENGKPMASTLIGGTQNDYSYTIALGAGGEVYIGGGTSSIDDFPTTAGAYSGAGTSDPFVTMLNSDFSEILASTLLGGSNSNQYVRSLALDAEGHVYAAGYTDSADNAVAPGTLYGSTDAFVAKFSGDLATPATDNTAPAWPADKSLEANNIAETSLTLTWNSATDGVGVSGYKLYKGGVLFDTVSSAVYETVNGAAYYTYNVTGLTAGTTYSFQAQAFDVAGNQSTDGPSTTAKTSIGDDAAPTWPADKELKATDVAETSLTLTWTPAMDNVGVTAYNIYKGGALLDTVSSAVYETVSDAVYYNYGVTGLATNNTYTFKVEAGDTASNWSTDGPNLTVSTVAPDTVAPFWTSMDANALITNAISPTQTYFDWPAATDNVGVTGYQVILGTSYANDIMNNPSVIATVYGTTNCIITLPDTPGINYKLSMKAFDAAGNLSAYYSPMGVVPGESYGVYLIDAYLTAITSNPRVSSTGASIENSTSVPLKPMIKLNFKNNVVNDGVWDNSSYSNKDCITMQTVAGGVNVPVNVTRICDNDVFDERNNIFVTPVDTLAPGTQYKIIITTDLMPKNLKRSMMFERVVNFITEASASGSTAWASGGTLTASSPTPSGVTLNWTAADAGAGVTSYAIIKDNSDIIASVDGATTSCEVTGLTAGTDYTFQVQAFNSATNWSSPGPSTTATTTKDTATPTWTDAGLTESNVSGTNVTLTWSAASDDAAVTGYQIYRDGTSIATVSGTTLSYNVTGLTAETSYTFKVEAGDAAGHWTTDGPSLTVTTTAYTGGEVITGAYTVTPAADAAYTNGETGDGIDTMTVNAGYSGSITFTVSISPVTAHAGNEKAVFVQIRNGAQVNLNSSAADFDTVNTASASFEVQPGDVIKAFIVDDLYTTTEAISTVLEQ